MAHAAIVNPVTVANPIDQKRWKDLFDGALSRLNGDVIPASKQPIFRARQDRVSGFSQKSSDAEIAAAASSLAALWQVSAMKRRNF
jgi:hypothetical protein